MNNYDRLMLVAFRDTDECIPFDSAQDKDGYYFIKHEGKQKKAHRLVVEKHLNVVLTIEQFACHHCDNKSCVNVRHLYLGNAKTNHDDMVARGQKSYVSRNQGSKSGRTKLTEDQVLEMRCKLANGMSLREAAEYYGIDSSSVASIKVRRTWNHI